MPGLDPGIHVFVRYEASKSWMAGSSPAMTLLRDRCHGANRREAIESVRHQSRNGCTNMSIVEDKEPIVQLVTTRSDAEIAADIKRRLLEAFRPSLEIFDEASAAG